MATGPEIALAASARAWPDRLHRFLLDHGGGRVRSRVMGPSQALTDQYEVLFIDDVCSFLTPRLVKGIRETGREIVGVYHPADAPDAKRRLLECGITDVIEDGAGPDEFLAVATATMLHRGDRTQSPPRPIRSLRVGVTGPIGGVGATEIAIGIASCLSSTRRTVLVDLDQSTPSVAQRLDLPLHPNLLTALDAAHHSQQGINGAVLHHEAVDVIGGLVSSLAASVLAPVEIEGLLDGCGEAGYEVVVADLGSNRPDLAYLLRLNVLIAVGVGNPVGLSRLIRFLQERSAVVDPADTVAVINRTGPGSRKRLEIRAEMARLAPGVPVILLPDDRRLERAAWDGRQVVGGPFARSVARVSDVIGAAIS